MKSNNKTIDSILLVIGILSSLYFFILLITISFNSFLCIYPFFSILIIGYAYIEMKYQTSLLSKLPSLLQKISIVGIVLGLTIFCITEVLFYQQANNRYQQASDYIIVLGAQVKGTSLSPSLKYRLDATIEYYQQFPSKNIIVSGGQGVGEDDSEANVMKKYLIEHGIDASIIITEDKSTNTYENLTFSKNILDTLSTSDYQVTIITNGFHCYRSLYIAKHIGLNAYTYSAKEHALSTPHYYLREFFGFMKEIITLGM